MSNYYPQPRASDCFSSEAEIGLVVLLTLTAVYLLTLVASLDLNSHDMNYDHTVMTHSRFHTSGKIYGGVGASELNHIQPSMAHSIRNPLYRGTTKLQSETLDAPGGVPFSDSLLDLLTRMVDCIRLEIDGVIMASCMYIGMWAMST
ncbi:hypothetical protein BY996DRAFT_6423214 [Phakopsora pachyrhizi]|nr:hypothetical protein BY996DRAFT_6423214 [Phakopsora pachyrhizi]